MKKWLFEFGIIIFIILVMVIVINFFVPISTGEIEINVIDNFEGENEKFNRDEFDKLLDAHNGKEAEEFINENDRIVRTNRKLPSDKSSDYKTIVVDINIKNRSLFDLYGFSGKVKVDDPDSRILYTYSSVKAETADRLKETSIDVLWMKVYVGDYTDEELLKYIRGLDVEIYFENDIIGNKSYNVSLERAEYRVVD